MRLTIILLIAVLGAGCYLPTGSGTRRVKSSSHTLIRQTAPNQGMRRNDKFLSIDNQPGELIWVTGSALTSVAGQNIPLPVLSRASVVYKNALRHNQLHGLAQNPQGVVFRFSPGVETVKFPDGFGIPVNSNEPIFLGTESQCGQALPEPEVVSFQLELDFVRQRGLERPFVPLYCLQLNSLVSVGEKPLYFGVENPDPEIHGSGAPVERIATEARLQDGLGQKFADVWFMEPGEQFNHTLATSVLRVSRTTKIHHATGHTTTFGESLVLYDLTDDRPVVTLERNSDGPGLQQYSSEEGVLLHSDHEYEVVAKFQNTSGSTVRASAQMLLYIETPEFSLGKSRVPGNPRS
jgi:hypothetical protein